MSRVIIMVAIVGMVQSVLIGVVLDRLNVVIKLLHIAKQQPNGTDDIS